MQRWTEKQVQQLLKDGKIRSYRIGPHSHKGERKRHLKKVGKQKYWMEMVLQQWCEKNGLEMVPEFQFNPYRKFRFDYSIPSRKLAFEYEGIFGGKSRHTNVVGYSIDAEKYNLAVAGGWDVRRYTALNYKNLLNDLECLSKQS